MKIAGLNRIARSLTRQSLARRLQGIKAEEIIMLFTLAAILLIAWVLGLVGVYTVGAIFHLLLVLALVLFVVGLLSGGRAVV
jgi:hypothetical protein